MSAFQAMLGVFRDEGGFVGFYIYCFISGYCWYYVDSDSSLIGVSNTMSCDIFKLVNTMLHQQKQYGLVKE